MRWLLRIRLHNVYYAVNLYVQAYITCTYIVDESDDGSHLSSQAKYTQACIHRLSILRLSIQARYARLLIRGSEREQQSTEVHTQRLYKYTYKYKYQYKHKHKYKYTEVHT